MSDIPPWFGERFYPLTHFIGYRRRNVEPREPLFFKTVRASKWAGQVELVAHTFIATWVSIVFLALMSRGAPFRERQVPVVIAAFGAVAVLIFAMWKVPASQPRCVILANTLCAIIGVGIAKLFALSGRLNLQEPLEGGGWACPATALSVALAACQLLNLTHPPGGAVAILAASSPEVYALGWWAVPAVLTSSLIMVVWACLINNIFSRSYPQYWIFSEIQNTESESTSSLDETKAASG
ncbi:hypothetical protein CALVIDRAFT_537475 [Calocera viscosa TUFC12733]|uniref:HPP transmembrane region domain-containing protein n=1 Tax=Calocera viscosa (strain TUFC12733) TaxID=1330018 RepID=A0A167M3R1_CALVF|nr:hypothetical protein CALVIDRAFT_537475 [Calocera viscosa TUFC12733]